MGSTQRCTLGRGGVEGKGRRHTKRTGMGGCVGRGERTREHEDSRHMHHGSTQQSVHEHREALLEEDELNEILEEINNL